MYQQKDFDQEIGELLTLFLRRLESPICFVAHNGGRFDYPLLCAELQSTGCVLLQNSKEPLLCIDTFEMYRDLAGDPVMFPNRFLRDPIPDESQGLNADTCHPGETTPSEKSAPNEAHAHKRVKLESDDDTTEEMAVRVNVVDHSSVRRQLFPDDPVEDSSAKNGSDSNETHPPSGSSSPIDFFSDTDDDNDNKDESAPWLNGTESIVPSSSQNTNDSLGSFDGPITLTGSARPVRRIVGQPIKRPSYKLVDLHQRIIGCEPAESHRAEDDCLTLARIFWLTPNAPLWADVNAIEFDRFSPLYTPRRRKPLPSGIFPSSS